MPKKPEFTIAPRAVAPFLDVAEALFPRDPKIAQVNRLKIDIMKHLHFACDGVNAKKLRKHLGLDKENFTYFIEQRVDKFSLNELISFTVLIEPVIQARLVLSVSASMIESSTLVL